MSNERDDVLLFGDGCTGDLVKVVCGCHVYEFIPRPTGAYIPLHLRTSMPQTQTRPRAFYKIEEYEFHGNYYLIGIYGDRPTPEEIESEIRLKRPHPIDRPARSIRA